MIAMIYEIIVFQDVYKRLPEAEMHMGL